MKRKKTTRLPRMTVLAVDLRELLAFNESLRRAPDVVRDLETLLALYKRRPRQMPKELSDEMLFGVIWSDLELGGHVDAEGGDRFKRVYAEWQHANTPRSIARFILEHAVPSVAATAQGKGGD